MNMGCLGPQDITGFGWQYSQIYVLVESSRQAAEVRSTGDRVCPPVDDDAAR